MQKYERRRCRRFPIKLNLTVAKLYKQDYIQWDEENIEICLFDVSRTGIGFFCEKDLPMDYYFDTKIDFDEKNYLYCVVKIVRIGRFKHEGNTLYGAEFVGLAPFLADKIDEYGKRLDMSGAFWCRKQ